jgi:hypothetical protein
VNACRAPFVEVSTEAQIPAAFSGNLSSEATKQGHSTKMHKEIQRKKGKYQNERRIKK